MAENIDILKGWAKLAELNKDALSGAAQNMYANERVKIPPADAVGDFFKRNSEIIRGACRLLQGKTKEPS